MRDTSLAIAVAVAKVAYTQGLTRESEPENLEAHIRAKMYRPVYESYVS